LPGLRGTPLRFHEPGRNLRQAGFVRCPIKFRDQKPPKTRRLACSGSKIEYDLAAADRERLLATIREAAETIGIASLAKLARISCQHLYGILPSRKSPPDAWLSMTGISHVCSPASASPHRNCLPQLRQAIDPDDASTPNTPNSQAAREPETMPTDPLPHLTQP